MFAYLISEVLCNIYQIFISTVRKAASPDLPQRLDQERPSLESIFKAPGWKNIYHAVLQVYFFKNSPFGNLQL